MQRELAMKRARERHVLARRAGDERRRWAVQPFTASGKPDLRKRALLRRIRARQRVAAAAPGRRLILDEGDICPPADSDADADAASGDALSGSDLASPRAAPTTPFGSDDDDDDDDDGGGGGGGGRRIPDDELSAAGVASPFGGLAYADAQVLVDAWAPAGSAPPDTPARRARRQRNALRELDAKIRRAMESFDGGLARAQAATRERQAAAAAVAATPHRGVLPPPRAVLALEDDNGVSPRPSLHELALHAPPDVLRRAAAAELTAVAKAPARAAAAYSSALSSLLDDEEVGGGVGVGVGAVRSRAAAAAAALFAPESPAARGRQLRGQPQRQALHLRCLARGSGGGGVCGRGEAGETTPPSRRVTAEMQRVDGSEEDSFAGPPAAALQATATAAATAVAAADAPPGIGMALARQPSASTSASSRLVRERAAAAAAERAADGALARRVDHMLRNVAAVNAEAETLQYGALLQPLLEGTTRLMAGAVAADGTGGELRRGLRERDARGAAAMAQIDGALAGRRRRGDRDGSGGDGGSDDDGNSGGGGGASSSRGSSPNLGRNLGRRAPPCNSRRAEAADGGDAFVIPPACWPGDGEDEGDGDAGSAGGGISPGASGGGGRAARDREEGFRALPQLSPGGKREAADLLLPAPLPALLPPRHTRAAHASSSSSAAATAAAANAAAASTAAAPRGGGSPGSRPSPARPSVASELAGALAFIAGAGDPSRRGKDCLATPGGIAAPPPRAAADPHRCFAATLGAHERAKAQQRIDFDAARKDEAAAAAAAAARREARALRSQGMVALLQAQAAAAHTQAFPHPRASAAAPPPLAPPPSRRQLQPLGPPSPAVLFAPASSTLTLPPLRPPSPSPSPQSPGASSSSCHRSSRSLLALSATLPPSPSAAAPASRVPWNLVEELEAERGRFAAL